MDRRVTKGRKGIAFYDSDGYKQFVFDANDTHGDTRYTRPILPMKRLLGGLDEINDTSLADSEQNDYVKIHKGVESYLKEQDELSGDKVRDRLLVEGITYSLYSKTGFPKSAGIKLAGLPYSYSDNADLVKEVYIRADMLAQDIEEAYRESREEVKVIDDTEEETVSDEPVVIAEQIEPIHEEQPKSEDPSHSEYPVIIDRELFEKVNRQKSNKGHKKEKQPDVIEYLKSIVYCGNCGKLLRRRVNWGTHEKWYCTYGCQCEKHTDDGFIYSGIRNLLSFVNEHPQTLERFDVAPTYTKTQEIVRYTNEIGRYINERTPSFNAGKKLIMECAAVKFSACRYNANATITSFISEQLSKEQEYLRKDFLRKIIDKITVNIDGDMTIRFIGGIEVNESDIGEKNGSAS